MKYPEFLPENGTIGFVAPSFGCSIEPYHTAFLNAQKKFTGLGHRLELGPNCYASEWNRHQQHSGSMRGGADRILLQR